MLLLVLPAAVLAVAAPAPPQSAPAPWAAEARCAAVLSVEAGRATLPMSAVLDSLPVEALIKMNRAAGVAKAAGVPRSVVERDVETFKVVFRKLEASKPAEFQGALKSCRIAQGARGVGES